MQIIETIVPIPLENLKKYFEDKNSLFLIDYKNSTIKDEKFFTYLSNLELPCDLDVNAIDEEDIFSLFEIYLNSDSLIEIPALEILVVEVLHEYVGVIKEEREEFKECRKFLHKIIEMYEEDILKWCEKLTSLVVYNAYTINDDNLREDLEKNYPIIEEENLKGINFVNLLKYEHFYIFYENTKNFERKIYKSLFNDSIFKGKNLYYYWAQKNNPFYFMTSCITTGLSQTDEFRIMREYISRETKKIFEEEKIK